MTRFLSESLQAREPYFRHDIRFLESVAGHPSADIRLTAEMKQQLKAKIRELGLDPADTTDRELYHALQQRLQRDDAVLTRTLQTLAATYISAEGDVVEGMVHALRSLPAKSNCYVLKNSKFKTIIRKMPPKKTMKILGYRSVASFLKHEQPADILTLASAAEDSRWQQSLLNAYKKLKPSDFESRPMVIMKADCRKWHDLATKRVTDRKHTILSFKELGALVIMPVPAQAPSGTVTATLALALHELNEVRACSNFLKLCRVRADFGELVRQVIVEEIHMHSDDLNRHVPWRLMQQYYARTREHFNDEVFEPHLQLDDLSWQPVERMLSAIEPKLAFWQGTAHLGKAGDARPVSFNLVDAALNHCNGLRYESRITRHFQQSLWQELLLRYLHPAAIERSVMAHLQPELANEYAIA